MSVRPPDKIRSWLKSDLIAAAMGLAAFAGPAWAASSSQSEPPSPELSAITARVMAEPHAQTPVEDPLEPLNRQLFGFDVWVDKTLAGKGRILPTAKWIARPVRHGLYNVFDNLEEPATIANDLMQTKVRRSAGSAGRFAINSTVGVFGVFDVASKFKLKRTREDFGQTLAIWGITPGPYVYVPIAGPTTARDSLGGLVDALFLPDHWLPVTIWEEGGINFVHFVVEPSTIGIRQVARAAAEAGETKDEYATLRQLYYDQRADQIANKPNLADNPVAASPDK